MKVELLHNTPLRTCKICGITADNKELLSLFINHKQSKFSKKNLCKKCNSKKLRTQETNEKNRIRTNKLRLENKIQGLIYVKEYYGYPFECMLCGYTSDLFAPFDLHHRNNKEKEGTPSQLMKQSFNRFKVEVQKCDLLCSNCHRIKHYKENKNEY